MVVDVVVVVVVVLVVVVLDEVVEVVGTMVVVEEVVTVVVEVDTGVCGVQLTKGRVTPINAVAACHRRGRR